MGRDADETARLAPRALRAFCCKTMTSQPPSNLTVHDPTSSRRYVFSLPSSASSANHSSRRHTRARRPHDTMTGGRGNHPLCSFAACVPPKDWSPDRVRYDECECDANAMRDTLDTMRWFSRAFFSVRFGCGVRQSDATNALYYTR